MTRPPFAEQPPTFLGITLRRSMTLGRLYLVVGVAYLVLLAAATSFAGGTAFADASILFLPVFAMVGSLGGVIVFTSDRQRGVFEYLLAYGVTRRRLFENILAATLLLATLVMVVGFVIDLGVLVARGRSVPTLLLVGLAVYGVPMGYGSAAFTATVGMYWTTLSSPRQGISSPIGILPLVGMIPSLATLGAAIALGISGLGSLVLVLGTGVALVGLVVLLLLNSVDRFLPNDRFLAPA